MASGHVNRANRPNTWLLRPTAACVKKTLANPEPSTHGPLLPTPHRSRAGSYQGSSCRVGDWPDGGP